MSLFLGPLLALASFVLLQQSGQPSAICWTASITLLCAVWWIMEPVPTPVTALLPLALFPMLGVLTPDQVGQAYGSPLVLLLMGGSVLSAAMEKSGAHRRVALTMVNLFGGNSSRTLVFGFMTATALVSMWISNAATALMMLPVALAVIEKTEDPDLPIPLLLGIAFAASIGGVGTPIGTPPNLIFQEVYRTSTGREVTFFQWMSWGVPVMLCFLPIAAAWLTRNLRYKGPAQFPEVGQWSSAEKRVMLIFSITALAWITREQPGGGWSELLNMPQANDASVALLAVVVMCLIPSGQRKGDRLLDWKTASGLPWGVLILFGGGLAIAEAFMASGLSGLLGGSLRAIAELPTLLMIALTCLFVTFLSEVTSNTALTSLLMPILAAAALASGLEPRLIMVPAAMSASYAFMLPVGTAPNAIIYGTGRFGFRTMAREGFVLNLLGAVVITTLCYLML